MTGTKAGTALPERRGAQQTNLSGVGGIGGGTGLIGIAHSLGPNSSLGAVLLFAAPAVTVLTAALLKYLELQASQFIERRAFERACVTLRDAITDERYSVEQRELWRRQLEQVVDMDISRKVKQVSVQVTLDGYGEDRATAATDG